MTLVKTLAIFGILTATALLAGCNSTTSGPAPCMSSCVVNINGITFNPQALTVKAGTAVTWKVDAADSTAPHNVKAVNNAWPASDDSPNLAKGASFSHTFATAGTFSYYCSYHGTPDGKSGMVGTITVVA